VLLLCALLGSLTHTHTLSLLNAIVACILSMISPRPFMCMYVYVSQHDYRTQRWRRFYTKFSPQLVGVFADLFSQGNNLSPLFVLVRSHTSTHTHFPSLYIPIYISYAHMLFFHAFSLLHTCCCIFLRQGNLKDSGRCLPQYLCEQWRASAQVGVTVCETS
jgi:hypothetical protein